MAVSFGGLAFAILQLIKLRGATQAAREAAEATRLAVGKELATTELTRLDEQIENLRERHRNRDRDLCLTSYPEIRASLLEIRRRQPNFLMRTEPTCNE